MEQVVSEIPGRIASTPVQTVQSGARLACPLSDCDFQYWNARDRQGKRTPTVQDKFSARTEPCQHFHGKWTPANQESLKSVLEDAAEAGSEIFCVVDEQVPLEASAQLVLIYVEQQTTLGGF